MTTPNVSHLAALIEYEDGRLVQRCQRCRIVLCEGDVVAWEPGQFVRVSGRNPVVHSAIKNSVNDPPADLCRVDLNGQQSL